MPAIEIGAVFAKIAGTLSSVNTAIETVEKMADRAKLKDKAPLLESQNLLISLKAELLDLKEAVLGLQEENSELRAQIRAKEEGAANREKYERKKIGQGWAMVPEGENEPYFCVSCYEAGNKVLLNPLPQTFWDMATHDCPKCKARQLLR